MTPKIPDEDEGRGIIGKRKRESSRLAAKWTPVAGLAAFPLPASASEPLGAASAQMDVGTLPLLAALGIGIAVAAGAVIAFLQVTAKGKQSRDSVQPHEERGSAYEEDNEHDPEEWNANAAAEEDYDDYPIADYTIPVAAMLSGPDDAEPAGEGEAKLCGLRGEHAGASYRLAGRRLSLGRDPSQCGVVFPFESGEISRKHCTVRYVEGSGTFLLEDHGSSNGTFLSSGERLQPGRAYELRSGDRFSLSGTAHLFEVREG